MEDIEKRNEGEELGKEPISEPVENNSTEEKADSLSEREKAPEESGAVSEPDSDPLPAPVSESVPRTVYHWNYDQSREYAERETRKKNKNAALIYAATVSAAFIICFAALIFTLLFDFAPAGVSGSDGSPNVETVVKVEERVVYVREDDGTRLTTQEIYDKCLPSTVSLIVSDGASSATGSGFFVREDGYIATANHVIEGMTSVKVILSDGTIHEASVIGGNEYTDIAVVKIEKKDCPAIAVGSSSKLLVGDDVVAIGTPASTDFAGSMAKGSVSYKNRMLKIYNGAGTAVEKKMRLIQTDALVNPGNSGCPLINEYGEAVGIVTMKLNSTYYEGMCFAIPSDAAMPIINAMIAGEDYERLLGAVSMAPAVLGISGQNVSIEEDGVYGVRVEDFTSADYDAASKLKRGDIITAIDGVAVASITELRLMIDKKLPGESASLTFYRDGQFMTVTVVMGS